MSYGIFMHRADSIYDDSPAEQYQFPSQYLDRAAQCVNDWIIYLEPRKVPGSRGYFAVARVEKIIPDPTTPRMYLALMTDYIDFPAPVPFSVNGAPVERGLLNEKGRLSGRAQSAVRPLSAEDFKRIVDFGLEEDATLLPRTDAPEAVIGLEERQTPFKFETDRTRVLSLTSRPVRDRAFRRMVLNAYNERCAISGLKLINGGGRAEVDAAHIRPVEAHGPDCVTNGIALSGTAHWMFDRGLIRLSDDLTILISRQANDPEAVRTFVNPSGQVIGPMLKRDRPHPRFLEWHRDNCFKR
ncbi:MAG: HNH endonuclease [Thalassobaculum sp.]